uniref:Uncharacterized protein n=1 Tax=Arion vulgaris TaxID=1028688 RepID=A0A0B6ZFY9_9EUPU
MAKSHFPLSVKRPVKNWNGLVSLPSSVSKSFVIHHLTHCEGKRSVFSRAAW